jgi:hypothetical protein
MNTEMHRAALPDDDPAELLDPAEVAEAFLAIAAGDVPQPEGRLEAASVNKAQVSA